MSLSNEAALEAGARKPTALDLTNSPLGQVNPNADETVGRTAPQSAGQVEVREVVLPPLPLSSMQISSLIRGK